MELILFWDNKLIQMSLTDAEKEIEASLREVIGGLKACSLTKHTGKILIQYVLNYLRNFSRVLLIVGI